MRIIKRRVKETKIICPHCASKLAYIKNDIYTTQEYDLNDWYNKDCILCPACKEAIVLVSTPINPNWVFHSEEEER